MKNLILVISTLFSLLICCTTSNENSNVVTSDIDNFWNAYDKITSTTDSVQQYQYINELFLDKGSPGLKAIRKVRNYSAKSYIDAINDYPLFWKSVRENTYQSKSMASGLEAGIQKLEKLYPLKPAKIYFTIGALRTNGTTLDDKVLIGSELAMADTNTVSSEFPDLFSHLPHFFKTSPIDHVVLLNIHEYVHTQQKSKGGYNLLSQCIFEGVAEFVSVIAMEQASASPAVAYGAAHPEKVRARFETEMFSPNWNDWLYNNFENEFQTRDLGYYVGYAIAEKYYNEAINKKQAIKELIELNYSNKKAVEKFADKTGYFSKPIAQLKEQFEQNCPSVVSISSFENGSQKVDPNITQITINFSAPMNQRFRGFDLGPLGEKNVLRIKRFIGFSEDGKSATMEIELKPNQRFQVLISEQFRSEDGATLQPYLVDIKTRSK